MPIEDTVKRILSVRPELTREEVLGKIEAKEKEAKGFLTRESAARAVAAELGVGPSGPRFRQDVSIADLVPGLGNVTVTGRVIIVYPLQKFAREDGAYGMTRRLVLGDKTGELKVVLWDDKADVANAESLVGQIVRFARGYVRSGLDGRPELNVGAKADLKVVPENVLEEDIPPLASFLVRATPRKEEDKCVVVKLSDLKNSNEIVSVEGTVATTPVVREVVTSRGEKVRLASFKLADETGEVEVALWRECSDLAKGLSGTDRVRISRVHTSRSISGRLRLDSGKATSVDKL